MHTRYAQALFYLNVYGNTSFNVVGTQKELEIRIDSMLQVLKRGFLLSMEIDVAATRYESCQQTGLFVCATPDAYRKHDVSFNTKGSRYPLIMTNDLRPTTILKKVKLSCPFAVPYISRTSTALLYTI
jgi:hypothetical protein